MKLIRLKQAKIEDESNPRVTPLGDCAINIEEITQVHVVIDKYDLVIKGVVGIRTRQAEGFYIIGNFEEILEQIENAMIT